MVATREGGGRISDFSRSRSRPRQGSSVSPSKPRRNIDIDRRCRIGARLRRKQRFRTVTDVAKWCALARRQIRKRRHGWDRDAVQKPPAGSGHRRTVTARLGIRPLTTHSQARSSTYGEGQTGRDRSGLQGRESVRHRSAARGDDALEEHPEHTLADRRVDLRRRVNRVDHQLQDSDEVERRTGSRGSIARHRGDRCHGRSASMPNSEQFGQHKMHIDHSCSAASGDSSITWSIPVPAEDGHSRWPTRPSGIKAEQVMNSRTRATAADACDVTCRRRATTDPPGPVNAVQAWRLTVHPRGPTGV